MRLESYLSGRWQAGSGDGRALVDPVTGNEIARADSSGIDLSAGLDYARETGGAALGALNFAERGALLQAIAATLQDNRANYEQIARLNSGNTSADASIDIDGAIFTLEAYARIGRALGNGREIVEPGQDQLARDPVFFTRHFWTGRPGVAVQINAFNFPAWGMWEKIAQALLAGVPCFAKPATATALLSERMMRDVISAGAAPDGTLSILCGQGAGITELLGPMDSAAFTGSAATARLLRSEIAMRIAAPRLNIEADSINATILGADIAAGDSLFDLAVREAVKALSVKAGQLCTNIRRILVPAELSEAFCEALTAKTSKLVVGDPGDENTRVGPLINAAQRHEAETHLARLSSEAQSLAVADLPDVAPRSGFFAPRVLRCEDPALATAVHEVEVFGPCLTILPYRDLTQAITLTRRAEGSLALSVFTEDPQIKAEVLRHLGPWHGRIMMVDGEVGKAHTGHFNVMPQCVHGGPGRAGGGEELGGVRGLRFHMQRSSVQAGPATLANLQDDTSKQAL